MEKLNWFQMNNPLIANFMGVADTYTTWDKLMPVVEELTRRCYSDTTDIKLHTIWEKYLGNNEQMFLTANLEEVGRNIQNMITEYNEIIRHNR